MSQGTTIERAVVDTVFDMISRQSFAVFYGECGAFTAYITGDEDHPVSEAQAKQILAQLLGFRQTSPNEEIFTD